MVRALAVILTSFTMMSAFAEGNKIDRLAKVARESTDLESVHAALNELYQLAVSPAVDAEFKREAGGTLIVLAKESAARIDAPQGSERDAEDLLTLHMASLGRTGKPKALDIEQMIALGTERMKIAAIIFLRDHFSAKDPREGFFPLRPESSETHMMNWQTDGMVSVIEKMPVILATIFYNSSLKRGTKLGEISVAAYTQIAKTLSEAAHDVKPDPNATKEALAIRIFRQRLAAHWLDELSKTLLAWRQIRFPNPEVKPDQKPDNPNAIDPLEELSSIMDCEDALVTPIERTSKTLH